MKNKATLTLMELSVMVLVLALCGGLCLSAFAWADRQAREDQNRQEALLVLQNAAEALKHTGGDVQKAAEIYGAWEDGWKVSGFEITAESLSTDLALLGSARLEIRQEGKSLGLLTVCWQEVSYGE